MKPFYADRCIVRFSWLVWFYGISTFVGYLTQRPFLCKLSVLFKTIRISMINCQKLFFQTIQLYKTIQFSVSTVSVSKIVQFKTIQFSKSTQFKCKYCLIVKKHSYFEPFSLVKQFSFSLFSFVKVQILFTHSYMLEQFYVKQFSLV